MENTVKKKKINFKTIDIVYIGVFAAVIAVCSWIQIPLTVPITLQTLGICTAAGLLGFKRGTLSVVVYVLLGLVGVPVFAGFSAGVGVIFGVTGGYILGFIFTGAITAFCVDRFGKKLSVYILSMVGGVIACYIFGTIWFLIFYAKMGEPMSLWSALTMCVFPFLIPDAVKIAVSAFICLKVGKYVKN